MGLKRWIVDKLRDGLRTERGRKATRKLLESERVRKGAAKAMESSFVREVAEELVESELVQEVAKDAAKDAARGLYEDVRDRVEEEASKLTEPIREYRRKAAAERAEREQREAAQREEQEIDDELEALKRRLGKD
ncbi:MAG: hypothetical protein JRI23_34780 [Deltaproteobacteria bacterium]|jgi:hypothetical protein|nr:hypothetical protein [Deltaproteobacteria bacterium]MBW2537473.1 hypothetical protein [Deltaproteobacteria bacterium]